MPADEVMTMKPACGDDRSVDDKELAVGVDEEEEEPLAVDRSRRCPRGPDALGGLREVYQVVVNDNVLILILI
jgi:hypothetical protein